MRKKKSSLTTTLIIILVIIVGGIFTYIYIQDKALEINQEEITKKSKKKQEEEIALDSEEVEKAISSSDGIYADDKYNNFDITSLDKYSMIVTALNGLNNDQITWCIAYKNQITATITIDDINSVLSNYIKEPKITIDDIKNNSGETGLTVGQYGYGSYAISIDDDNDIHVIGSCDGRGPGVRESIVMSKPIKSTKKSDELYIYAKVAYGKLNTTANALSYDYYKDSSKTGEMIETVSLDDDLTWDKYDVYKQIYKKDGDKYYLISSKKDN